MRLYAKVGWVDRHGRPRESLMRMREVTVEAATEQAKWVESISPWMRFGGILDEEAAQAWIDKRRSSA